MSVEIEAKFKIDNLEVIRAALRERGATLLGDYLETNVFFDTEDRSLLAADEGLRLRTARDLASGTETYVITFKGPRRHGQLKSREETEVMVSKASDAAALLKSLGYSCILTFEKRRQSWKLDACKVELDELPHIGSFVEIEGTNDDAVLAVRASLGMGDRPIVKTSYVALLLNYLQERGKSSRAIVFPPGTIPASAISIAG